MTAIYANENFPLPVVEELRRLGYDVLTSRDAGNAGRAVLDEEVLAFAVAQGRALVTINRKHFIRLHRESPSHTGIIVCTYDPDFIGQAARVAAALTAQPDLAGLLLRVNRPS
jgi:predicted nuclease of predicted toxin-antitoxin system